MTTAKILILKIYFTGGNDKESKNDKGENEREYYGN